MALRAEFTTSNRPSRFSSAMPTGACSTRARNWPSLSCCDFCARFRSNVETITLPKTSSSLMSAGGHRRSEGDVTFNTPLSPFAKYEGIRANDLTERSEEHTSELQSLRHL